MTVMAADEIVKELRLGTLEQEVLDAAASEIERLRSGLGDILTLASMGLEVFRLRRIEGGRNHDLTFVKEDGERWVGLRQEEYDVIIRARAALHPTEDAQGNTDGKV